MIKVIIVDDHQIICDGIASILKSIPDIELIGYANTGFQLMELIRVKKPDIILLDLNLPGQDGAELTIELLKTYPELKIIIHTMSEQLTDIESLVYLGAKGYILKASGAEEIINAIRVVYEGGTWFSSHIINGFIHTALDARKFPLKHLQKDELMLVKWLFEEQNYQEMAKKRNCNLEEIAKEMSRIRSKLAVKTDIGIIITVMKTHFPISGLC